jgi:hypothetical protein
MKLAILLFAAVRLQVETVTPEVIQQRLEAVQRDLHERRDRLQAMYVQAGCEAHITSQTVPYSKEPNLLCTLPAVDPDARTIVVGGHFDYAKLGIGAADNWSGAALLPSLYQSLVKYPRRHRFVFANFAAEESGLHGAREYVRTLKKEERAAVAAMVNIDTVGLAAPTIWTSRSDKHLASLYIDIASYLGQKPAGVNVEQVGDDDSHPFKGAKIPVISFHSVNQANLKILHSVNDNLTAIDKAHYYDTYRLVSLYLAYIDQALD